MSNDPIQRWLPYIERYLLTLDEAAKRLGISRRAIEGLVKRGTLHKAYLKGRPYLVSYEVELYQFSKQGKEGMIQDQKNRYTGINPHLMSLLQTPGSGATTSTFPSFHNDHITHIKDFLNDRLPPHYIALTEPSLQIQSRASVEESFIKDSQPSPDVAIYQMPQSSRNLAPSAGTETQPTLQLTLQLEEQKQLLSIGVYEVQAASHAIHGTPIVRIELLSPANMRGGSYGEAYLQNRTKCLLANTPLIEIDYLHEYGSWVKGVPHYPDEAGAKPYSISVSHPATKTVDVYLFGINEPISTVSIPLAAPETLSFDFGQPYAFTWDKSRFWFYVDYQQEPLRMHTYSTTDQQIIRDHIQAIARHQTD